MEDMFLRRTGTLECRVKENKPGVTKVWWEDENTELICPPMTREGNNLSRSLDITFDEWSQGIKRYCFVEHSLWVEPSKALYERSNGKKMIQQFCSKSLFNFSDHVRKHVLITGECILSQIFLSGL